jgi:hypothetical protein
MINNKRSSEIEGSEPQEPRFGELNLDEHGEELEIDDNELLDDSDSK